MPRPRFIVTSSSVCDANTSTFRTVAERYGMDASYIDVPYEYTKDAEAYVSGQLEELVRRIERAMERRMDWDALRRAVRNTNATVDYQRKFIDELSKRSFPNYISAEMHRILAGHNLLGTDDALAFFLMQYEDIRRCPVLRDRIPPSSRSEEAATESARGPGTPHGDPVAHRILWCHVLPYYAEPLKAAFDFSARYQLLMSDLNYDQLINLDEDDIFGSMARRLITNHFNGSAERRIASVTKMARKLRANGAVIFCHWGCKHSNGGAFLLRDALKDIGVDTLVIDGDACDRRNTNEGQLATRLQAFLEILDAGR
jgi:benzoyl-CoA reductase/2-hydroxyglutaryl-CoA dehydratase subunit BcrC/BadD/HgdB